ELLQEHPEDPLELAEIVLHRRAEQALRLLEGLHRRVRQRLDQAPEPRDGDGDRFLLFAHRLNPMPFALGPPRVKAMVPSHALARQVTTRAIEAPPTRRGHALAPACRGEV